MSAEEISEYVVSRLLREIGEPARTWMMARSASEAIKQELQRGDDDFALRALIVAIIDLRDRSNSTEIQELLRRPRPTGDRHLDTLLAAAVAQAGRRPGVCTEVETPGAVGSPGGSRPTVEVSWPHTP